MKRLAALLASIGLVLMALLPAVVHADVNDFRITNFTSDQTLIKTEGNQASLHIIERISVRFTDNNHGLLRRIPKTYQKLPLKLHVNKITSDTGAPAAYIEQSSDPDYTVLQIGDPNKTVTGNQEYTVDYTVQNVLTSYGYEDTVYWDVNGYGWAQPIDNIAATIHLPKGVALAEFSPKSCYVGANDDCTMTQQGDVLTAQAHNLQPYQSMSYMLNFEKGYFSPPRKSTVVSAQPTSGTGGVTDFRISKFISDQTLSRDDKQGKLHIVEHIEVEFSAYNHGIIRAIPVSYKRHPLKLHLNSVTSDTGAPVQVQNNTDFDNVHLKIGDPDRTVTGHQEYTIDYTVQNVIGFYKDHDELYWDVNGDQWDQPADDVEMTLHLPKGLNFSKDKPVCYAGGYGLRDSSRCTVALKQDGSDHQLFANANDLAARQTLTYVVGFQKGYFMPPSLFENFRDYAKVIIGLVVVPLISFIGGFVWWWRKGRDAPGKGTIVPEYKPPQGISPLEAGALVDFQVDNKDITATFIDLARRGYIKIIEKRVDRKILKDKLSYSLEMVRAEGVDLTTYEQTILNAVFPGTVNKDATAGVVIELDSLKNKFYVTADSIRKDVGKDLTTKGYFRQNPTKFLLKTGSIFSIAFAIGAFFVGLAGLFHLLSFLVGGIIGTIILCLFARQIPARTTQGVAAKEQLLGLKLYMETAEKDRMKMLEGPNAAYASNAGEPVRTVELFESLLPYAIIMGVEKEWSGQFKDIYAAQPDWYNGNITSFNTGYLIGSLNGSFNAAVNTSFTAPGNSGSSGFGGGGFSGGGGGGGGGGGW